MILRPAGILNLSVTREMQVQNTSNIYILCQTNAGAINIILPRISSLIGVPNSTFGFRIFITDDNNNASVNNITITPNPADKINGASSVVLNTNGATGHLLISGLKEWDFNVGSSSSGGGESIFYAERTLTSPEILSLNSTPIEIVPAQGIGKAIIPSQAVCQYFHGGSSYIGVPANSLVLRNFTVPAAETQIQSFVTILEQPSSRNWIANMAASPLSSGLITQVVPNNGLFAWYGRPDGTGGNPTGGNGTAKIQVWYFVKAL